MNRFYRILADPFGGFLALIMLIGLVLFFTISPALQRTHGRRRPQCMVNLHQISLAVQNHASVNGGKLPSATSGSPEQSWRVLMLPLLDHAWLYRKYDRQKLWDDPANDEFAKTKIPAYICPENPTPTDSQGRYYTVYALLTGSGTAFSSPEPISLDDFSDGISQTILAVEASGANIVWNEPRDIDVTQYKPGVEVLGSQKTTSDFWISAHHDGASVVFADGSVRALSANINPEVLKALATPNQDDNPSRDSW